MGHSLGGTLAAILACLEPASLRGLVLVSSPLCFARGLSRFGDALADMELPQISDADIVSGAFISQLSAIAAPDTFIWSRVIDAAMSVTDIRALGTHIRIERWALDEVPVPAKLVRQMLSLLYRENRFSADSLFIGPKLVGPSRLRVPTIAVANAQDDVAPPASMSAFLRAAADAQMAVYPGEVGAGLQHLAALVGSKAHAQLWPCIVDWLRSRG
jgi:polyhydroxyalkanoate synthase